MNIIRSVFILLVVTILNGCASGPKPLYSWNEYQPVVYEYYALDMGPQEQIEILKKDIEKARAKALPVPPGLHAHLGMLYINTGHPELAKTEFEQEKRLFPESTQFMDFLLKKMQGGKV